MDINKIKNLIRIGTISAVNGAACSARVVFDDKDDLVSAELPIITIGSSQTRAYWIPEVGTCAFSSQMPAAAASAADLSSALFTAPLTNLLRVIQPYAVSRLLMAALSGMTMVISR